MTARERTRLAWQAVRAMDREHGFGSDELLALVDAGAVDLTAALLRQRRDPLARRDPGFVLAVRRHRCQVCGALRTDLRGKPREHAVDCDEIPF